MKCKTCWTARALPAAVALLALAACSATEDTTRQPLREANGELADTLQVHNPTDADVVVRLTYGVGDEHRVTAPAGTDSVHDLPREAIGGELFVEYPSEFAGSIELLPLCIVDCLAAGTEIATPDGLRAVEALRSGDFVTTDRGAQRVAATRAASAERLVELRVADAIVQASLGHRFLTERGWRRADELTVRDRILGGTGDRCAVDSVRVLEPESPVAVHSILLDDQGAGLLVAARGLVAR